MCAVMVVACVLLIVSSCVAHSLYSVRVLSSIVWSLFVCILLLFFLLFFVFCILVACGLLLDVFGVCWSSVH